MIKAITKIRYSIQDSFQYYWDTEGDDILIVLGIMLLGLFLSAN